jgi:CBS domain-containing protein
MKSIRSIVANRDTVTVESMASVLDAARLMTARQIGAVPVVDGERLVGIFTERDVMARIVAEARDPRITPISEVMSTTLVVTEINESFEVCLGRMQQARVRHMLVLDNGRLAGILSLRDLMAADLDDKEEAISLLNAYVHYIPADLSKVKT